VPAPLTQLSLSDDLAFRRHAEALRARLGPASQVRFDRHNRMLYATDASIYQVEPIGVVIPSDLDAARVAARYCFEHRLPILPRGGGTSLAGQCVNHAVVIDFSAHCNAVESIDAPARTCRVQPGISIDDLNDHLRAAGHDLFFAPDPATSRQCNIGGAIGNNAAGTRSILYGRTSENLLALTALLSTGAELDFSRGSAARDPAVAALARAVIDIVLRHEQLIRERFPRTLRRNAGYALDMMLEDIDEARAAGVDPLETLNLAHLICGSEGTLALITGATLKLHPLPRAKGLAVLGFDSLEAAIDAVLPILDLKPSAVELLDDLVISLARENIEYRNYVELLPAPLSPSHLHSVASAEASPALSAVLYVEFFSDSGPDEIRSKFAALRDLVARMHPRAGFACYTTPAEMAAALKLRKAGEPLLHGIPGNRKPLGFVEDNAVPVERLAEFVRRFKAIVEREGTRAAFWAHASVGVLHVRPLLDLRDPEDRARMERIAVEVADLARELGGIMSGEHGDGRARGPLLERTFGPLLMEAFREIKRLFDPLNLFNPGIIVAPGPIESIHESTRVRPLGRDLRAPPIDTFFDYSAEHGFDHAVELCNGSGVCRKKLGGTMCPSYMATLDERHSTRGRGNALRLAITGQLRAARASRSHLPESAHAGTAATPPRPEGAEESSAPRSSPPLWNDPDTLETLHLCLSCKACKTECPTNVDIAQYKAEYLAQSYKSAGTIPLKARAFGNVRALNRLGSALAPFSNWIANSPPARAVADRLLGLHRNRSLPPFEQSLFTRLHRAAPPLNAGLDASAPDILLFADCFSAYNEPAIGLAAASLLNAFGYRVTIRDQGCCARALISMGLLRDAATTIRSTLRRLSDPCATQDDPDCPQAFLFLEPSCLSSVKDEWTKLRALSDRADAVRSVATSSFLLEDFIHRRWDSHPRRPAFRAPPGRVALHAHCHQKALWGVESSAAFLRRVVGPNLLRILDTGCCGMAGSFGYTADRYDLSMKIGELALFPALRRLGPDDIVVAPGTSCRHQIKDGAGRAALHPVQLAASLLLPDT